ncbi:hypothetical protein EVAR_82902_1 [Eumeta japonica]|uniref:Uncharacterized protein n=1 Tax=Eumeta variegata TaxID=151549 RepID=A0A4C1YK65_EUMVA|nr:hypothetical protein EVAR_82902_1 [Eumeta japonica]
MGRATQLKYRVRSPTVVGAVYGPARHRPDTAPTPCRRTPTLRQAYIPPSWAVQGAGSRNAPEIVLLKARRKASPYNCHLEAAYNTVLHKNVH